MDFYGLWLLLFNQCNIWLHDMHGVECNAIVGLEIYEFLKQITMIASITCHLMEKFIKRNKNEIYNMLVSLISATFIKFMFLWLRHFVMTFRGQMLKS